MYPENIFMILKKQYRILLLCLFWVILLSSCVTTKDINYLQSGYNIPQYADTVGYTDYKLQRGDYLYIRVVTMNADDSDTFNGSVNVSGASQMSSDNSVARLYLYLIGEDNCIDYPYVGKLDVVGLNLREVKGLLEEKLATMLNGFSIDVRLSNRTFSVIGESGAGRYKISREKINIFDALAMSGGLTDYSKRKDIQIIRQTADGTIVKSFDIRSEGIINSEFYYIQPNDVIYVPFRDSKYWGLNNFTSVLSVTFASISFSYFIYSVVHSIVKLSNPE